MAKDKTYLGDSVYAAILEADDSLVLTTENGDGEPTNTIYFDGFTLNALIQYIELHYGQHLSRR